MAGKLFKDSRASLAYGLVSGADTVTVLLAVDVGRLEDFCDRVSRLDGSVVRRHDEIGYVRAVVPVGHVDELVADEAVNTASVMFTSNAPPSPSTPSADGVEAAPTIKTTTEPHTDKLLRPPRLQDPIASPYSPLKDLGAEELLAQHPTWDGRGVTVAIIDGFIDQLLPEFQTATALDGTPVPKILDCVNPMDPHLDGGPEWVTKWEEVKAVDGKFTVEGQAFAAPRDGTFNLGFLDESRLRFVGGDLTRDGNPEVSSPLYGVLWDKADNTVWVDTDQDQSFADEKAMTDYHVRQDIGIFGDAESIGPVRESVMFTVQIRPELDAVAINVGGWLHATLIAGGTFGSRGTSGRLDGMAPGAQIVSINPSRGDARSNPATFIEALIAALSDPRVDLVVYEWNSFTVAGYLPKDGTSIMSVLAKRLVDIYDKPLFVPASNAGWLNQTSEESVGSRVICVGSYQSKECYRINEGILVPEEDNLNFGSSHGPAGDGGMAPLLLAPPNVLTTKPAHRDDEIGKGTHDLPVGYAIGGGTSTAAPSAAAAAALLISAAKQSGISYDAERVRRAMSASARFLPNIPAHRQGHGLIQVESAWRALCELHEGRDATADIEIGASAPVHTAISGWLRSPDRGRGLYEREGWTIGDRRTRAIWVTRTRGPGEPIPYTVTWLGNDDETFFTSETITLPLNTPVELTVEIAPTTHGVHSATLVLLDPSKPLGQHRIPVTVVVPAHDLTDRHNVEPEVEFSVSWPGATYFRIPAGTTALQIESPAAPEYDLPWITPPHGTTTLQGEPAGSWTHGGRARKTWSYPPAGVWEAARVDASIIRGSKRQRMVEAKPRTEQMSATLFGVDVDPALPIKFDPRPGSHLDLQVELINRRAGFTGGVRSRSLGAARELTATITKDEMQVHEIEVPPGSELLLASAQGLDADCDLDVYLFDCTGPNARLFKKHTTLPHGGVLSAEDPTPGAWKVVVDAFRTPGSTTYQYFDVFTNPRFGSLSTTDVPREFSPEETWPLTLHTWFAELPEEDRVPAALVLVTSDDIKLQVGPTQWNPIELLGMTFSPDPRVEHVPLGWAVVLFHTDGPRIVTD